MKVWVIINEQKGLIEDAPLLFLDFGKAWQKLEGLWNEEGFTWDEKESDFFDKQGKSRRDGDIDFWYHLYESKIEDLNIDTKLLDKQIRAMLDSNLPEPHKAGLHELLGTILDACEE